MSTYGGMKESSKVELETNSNVLVVDGEEMQSTASAVTTEISSDLLSVKEKLAQLSRDSDLYWKESAGDAFRTGVSDMNTKLDTVITDLTDAVDHYQQMGSGAVDLVSDNTNVINASLGN